MSTVNRLAARTRSGRQIPLTLRLLQPPLFPSFSHLTGLTENATRLGPRFHLGNPDSTFSGASSQGGDPVNSSEIRANARTVGIRGEPDHLAVYATAPSTASGQLDSKPHVDR